MEMNTSVLKQKAKPQAEIEKEMAEAARQLGDAELVELFIPEAYKASFGVPFRFSVNGVSIEVPIGMKVKVPAPHALQAQRMMKGAVLSKNQKRLTPEEVYND